MVQCPTIVTAMRFRNAPFCKKSLIIIVVVVVARPRILPQLYRASKNTCGIRWYLSPGLHRSNPVLCLLCNHRIFTGLKRSYCRCSCSFLRGAYTHGGLTRGPERWAADATTPRNSQNEEWKTEKVVQRVFQVTRDTWTGWLVSRRAVRAPAVPNRDSREAVASASLLVDAIRLGRRRNESQQRGTYNM